ncbi:histidine kinase [Enterococcus gallinarum]|uniref:histidine kinase n=1 Tax=Enterococcus gallinarum TaxID=1353 RepID=UPI0009BF506C|nr:histidine kinase [Enterococcus gallinarum]OQO76579.1 histidine kinase [Enterococcus gallinarum]
MALKDGIKIIIQDVVEPEPEKEGCLTKIGSFIVAMVVIVGLLSLLFRFLMNHPFVLIVGIAVIVFFLVQASKK